MTSATPDIFGVVPKTCDRVESLWRFVSESLVLSVFTYVREIYFSGYIRSPQQSFISVYVS